MTRWDRWRLRARALFDRAALDREMDNEMRFHIEMETREGVSAGLSPDDARRRAVQAFGNVHRYREKGREARGVSALDDAVMDLRYGARALRRSPLFAVVAVATLALGIGANTAFFSVVNGVLLRPLPYADPAALVSVWEGGRTRAEVVGVRDYNTTLVAAAGYRDGVGFSVSGDGPPTRLFGAYATADLFRVLGVTAAVGRGFAAGDDAPGNDAVVVLSHGFWRERFGGDSSIVGRALDLDGVARTVIGVMPAGFWFPRHETRLWVPLRLDASAAGEYWGAPGHFIVGRLRPDATLDRARADVRAIAERLRSENPVWTPSPDYYYTGLDVVSLESRIVQSGSRRLLLVLLGAVGMILFIACANVANLLIARGAAREPEIAIRATLGAARGRIVRQLATESLLLAGLGGLLGLALAAGGLRVMLRLLPADIPRLADVAIDGPVLAFTAGLTILVTLLLGVAPALRMSRPAVALGRGSSRSAGGREGRRLGRALVAAEIAIAVVLAVGAGLFLKSFGRLLEVDPGFRADQVVTARVSPPAARWTEADQVGAFYAELVARLRGVPTIRDVAITSQLPFDQSRRDMVLWVDGHTTDPNNLEPFEERRVTPDFFRTMGIPLLEGRGFSDADRGGAVPVAIIDEHAAQRFWKGRSAVGGRVRYPWPGWLTVVGVVGSVKHNDLRAQPSPVFYVPFNQNPFISTIVVARTDGSPAAAQGAIRAVVAELAPDVAVSDERSMEQLLEASVAQPRFASVVLLSFGLVALLLGAVGTYGLMASATQRRTREIAVRMALGARARDVLAAVVGEGAGIAAIGVAAGVALAFGLTRFLRGMLFEVQPTDPLVFAAVPVLLGVVALLASYLPARRAARIDPMIAIRSE